MKRYILLFCLLFILAYLAAETAFMREYNRAITDAARLALIQSYLKQPLSLDLEREIQAKWQELQPLAMQAYYDSLAAENPQNMAYQYFSLRYWEAGRSLPRLRHLLATMPDFYWNTRLYALNLCEGYLSKDPQATFTEADEALLKAALQYFPADAYLKIALFYLYLNAGKTSLASSYLAEIESPAVLAANWQSIESFLLSEKNIDLFDALSGTLWLDELETGNISPEEYAELQKAARDEFMRKIAQREVQDPGALK